MATVTIGVDDQLLAEVQSALRARGSSVEQELENAMHHLCGAEFSPQREAVERMIARAIDHPHSLPGGMPSREERNAR
jgi:hypothetical protein